MKKLKAFIELTWSGDVTYKEAIKGFTPKQLKQMENCLGEWRDVRQDGLEEELVQDNLNDNGLLLLQIMINNVD